MQITQNEQNQTKPRFDRLLQSPAWKQSGDYSGKKGRDRQKKVKNKRWESEWTREVKRQKRGTLAPRGVQHTSTGMTCNNGYSIEMKELRKILQVLWTTK